jgi:hypothetical protein
MGILEHFGSVGGEDRSMSRMEADPPWIRAAARAVLHEWRDYARTAWATTVAPARFARQWADGERQALNPFASIANALALVTVSEVLWRLVAHGSDELPPWFDLLRPALQLFHIAVTVSLFHFPLVLLGGRRPWRTSFAVALYVTSGPLLPLYLLRSVIVPMHLDAAQHLTVAQIAFAVGFSFVLLGYLVVALAGAHAVRAWRVAAAFVVGSAVLASAMVALKVATGAR